VRVMVERLVGAVVAIAAAGLLVAGAVMPTWWIGETSEIARGGSREAHLGLREERVCFAIHEAAGKPRCADGISDCDDAASRRCHSQSTVKESAPFGIGGWAATGLGVLAALLLLVAAGAAIVRGAGAARGWAAAGVAAAVAAGAGGATFVLMRPAMSGFEGDFAWPAYGFFGGVAAALVTGLIFRRPAGVAHPHAPRRPVKAPRRMQVDVERMLASRGDERVGKGARGGGGGGGVVAARADELSAGAIAEAAVAKAFEQMPRVEPRVERVERVGLGGRPEPEADDDQRLT
jgi:hypothetical protein